MAKAYDISREEAKKLARLRKRVKNEKADIRLHAVQLRGEGYKNGEIAEKLGVPYKNVSRWVQRYVTEGPNSLTGEKYCSHNWNMTFEEESELLAPYFAAAKNGKRIDVAELQAIYEERIGHTVARGQMYKVLGRHNWRAYSSQGRKSAKK